MVPPDKEGTETPPEQSRQRHQRPSPARGVHLPPIGDAPRPVTHGGGGFQRLPGTSGNFREDPGRQWQCLGRARWNVEAMPLLCVTSRYFALLPRYAPAGGEYDPLEINHKVNLPLNLPLNLAGDLAHWSLASAGGALAETVMGAGGLGLAPAMLNPCNACARWSDQPTRWTLPGVAQGGNAWRHPANRRTAKRIGPAAINGDGFL